MRFLSSWEDDHDIDQLVVQIDDSLIDRLVQELCPIDW
jgi:hypothetical protein